MTRHERLLQLLHFKNIVNCGIFVSKDSTNFFLCSWLNHIVKDSISMSVVINDFSLDGGIWESFFKKHSSVSFAQGFSSFFEDGETHVLKVFSNYSQRLIIWIKYQNCFIHTCSMREQKTHFLHRSVLILRNMRTNIKESRELINLQPDFILFEVIKSLA